MKSPASLLAPTEGMFHVKPKDSSGEDRGMKGNDLGSNCEPLRLPLKVDCATKCGSRWSADIMDAGGEYAIKVLCFSKCEAENRAAFIVKACNLHGELVGGLEDLLANATAMHCRIFKADWPASLGYALDAINRAQALLKKAGE